MLDIENFFDAVLPNLMGKYSLSNPMLGSMIFSVKSGECGVAKSHSD